MITVGGDSRQRGITIVELLIALLVSLILVGGVIEVFLSSKRTYRLQDALGRTQEDGRFAVEILNRSLRPAGYPQNAFPEIDAFPELTSITATGVPADHNAWEGGDDDLRAIPPVPDQFIVQYQANPSTASVTRDCLGAVIAPGATVVDWYLIDDDGAGLDGLACVAGSDPDGPPQVLVENVTNMQVTYGVDEGSSMLDGAPNRYYEANAVPDWDGVMAVRIRLAVDPGPSADPDATTAAARLRPFTTTIPIRNNLP